MADPLSLVASIIAVVGAAGTISKTLSKAKLLRKAPESLLALNNEITDLSIVLRTVEEHVSSISLEGRAPSQDVLQQISNLINQAKDRLLQLDQLIHYQFLKSGTLDCDYKIFRIQWLRAKEIIEGHRHALREIKQALLLQLAVLNSIQQNRIRLLVDEVFLVTNQIRTSQSSNFDQATQFSNRNFNLLNDLLARHGQLHDRLQSAQTVTDQQDEQSYNISQERVTASTLPSIVGIRTRLSMNTKHLCPASCGCNCHNIRSFGSPPLLRNLLGLLFVRYSGYPFGLLQRCSEAGCQSRLHFRARALYYFPVWLFSRIIDATLILSYVNEPSLSLTVRGTFSTNSDIFHAVVTDNDRKVRHLLSKGSARPNDIQVPQGDSLLLLALAEGCYKACKALLEANADRYLNNQIGVSAFTHAWDSIHRRSRDENALNYVRELFPDIEDAYLQERDFSRLHKAVLGIDGLDIRQVLAADGATVNKPDSNGASPFTWAIQRKDVISAELLFKAGADVNMRTKKGCTALHFAAHKSDLVSIRLLLRFGAMVSYQDNTLSTALMFAAQNCKILDVFRVLLAAGTDIEARDIFGNTALVCSAVYNNTFGIVKLLDFGAQIDVRDEYGDTPLLNAAFNAASNAVQILLERGADYTLVNFHGNTFLHRAAQSGDLEMINILRDANLKSIDPYVRNKKGNTAFELAQARVSKPGGFIDLFLVLLFEIRNRNDYLAGCQRLDDDARIHDSVTGEIHDDESSRHNSDTEEFFDAQEQ